MPTHLAKEFHLKAIPLALRGLGLNAGDGGFNINVNGNTDLKGAVIASSNQAAHNVDTNGNPINSLSTQTLTTSNIDNKAEYNAKGYSISSSMILTTKKYMNLLQMELVILVREVML